MKEINKNKKTDTMMISFIVAFTLFIEALDSTILNTAIPSMARSLLVSPLHLKIALISYLMSLALFIPISGWVVDKFGAKKVFISALLLFVSGSIWCGLSTTLTLLIIGRCIQGVGGAFSFPVGRLIMIRSFPRHEMIKVTNKVVMIAAMGVMLGPFFGGLITHHFSWRWIFWINIPFVILVIISATTWIKNFTIEHIAPFDFIGFVLFGAALVLLTFSLSALSEGAISNALAVILLSGALILLGLFFAHAQKIKNPIVDISLFRYRTFRLAIVGNMFSRLGFGGAPFLLPLLLQICLGYSSQTAGFLMMPMAFGILLVRPITLPLLRLFRFRKVLIVNTILLAFCLWSYQLINTHTSFYFIIFLVFLYGFLTSLQYTGMNALFYAEIPKEKNSAANSIIVTCQQLTQSFGVAIAAFLVEIYSNKTLPLSLKVLQHTFFMIGIITLLSAVIFFNIQPDDGVQMLKNKEEEK